MSLFDLLEADDRLVAHLEPLPFQEGQPLATVAEEFTELVDASSDELVSRQVLVAQEGEDDGDLPIAEFDDVSEDEVTANAGTENDADREARRARNRACTIWWRRVNERRRSMQHALDPEFTAVSERGFRTPVANIARVTAILKRSNNPNVHQALLYVKGPGSNWISKTVYRQGGACGREPEPGSQPNGRRSSSTSAQPQQRQRSREQGPWREAAATSRG
jgi:hypothetical protein